MSSNTGNNGHPNPGSSGGQLPPSSSSQAAFSLAAAPPSTTTTTSTAAAYPNSALPRPSARTLSCTLCQRRKIKCDRIVPCSNCIKANVVCTPSKPAPPRQRTRPRQDLQERLAKCETLLKQYADAERPVPSELSGSRGATASGASTPSTGGAHGAGAGAGSGNGSSLRTFSSQLQDGQPGRANRSPASTPGGRIVSEGSISGETRFIDGQLWELLNDEITSMKRLIESEEPEVYIPPHDPRNEFEDMSNCPSPSSDEKPELDPVQSFKLWQIFLDRVNPLVKIIHAPTLQPYLVQAAADISSIPLDYQGLLYSIFGLASIALTDNEAMSIIGCTKELAAQKFTKGLFHALTRFEFLRRYNMVVLQALVHALIILQSQYNRHASWVLSGSLVRIAISMGYHRDGLSLKLPPFETEMRRRIWWQIANYDLKLTMDCGFKHQSIPADFDTKPPLNLNDADMYPDAAGELKAREGPTEMAFVLISNRLVLYMLDEESRYTVESTILGQGTPETPLDPYVMDRNRNLIHNLEQDLLEIERRFLSPTAGNVHIAALGIRPPIISRLSEMMRPMTDAAEWGTEIFGPKDNLYKLLLSTSENISGAYQKARELGFSWYVRLHFHHEILASISSFMYQRPMGAFSDRGWRVMEQTYDEFPELFNLSQRAHITQAQFVLKAWNAREQAYQKLGSMIQVPEFVVQLRQLVSQHTTPGASTGGATSQTAGSTGQADVQMSTPSMQSQPLSFALEDQMGSNSVHSSYLTWDFLGNMGGDMSGMGDTYGGAFQDYGGPNPFQ